ncbi:hypothetical protein [Thiobacillus denitrificans]|uniref:hypothetical protein n=1 Tax=Thiobacillus denitrificans TaxID=36861 RepID=UPI00036BC393|nr:hypothetical protein [Thiobacillus denitrificans]
MPVFPKPKFAFDYAVAGEVGWLRKHKKTRRIPKRQAGKLLVATWNIANLGAQHRRDQDLSLIAEVINWFDIVAIQECRENFGGFNRWMQHTRDCVSRRSVADETKTSDLLHGKPESLDVGTLEERGVPSTDRPVV